MSLLCMFLIFYSNSQNFISTFRYRTIYAAGLERLTLILFPIKYRLREAKTFQYMVAVDVYY
jgi:hypothetical protein